MARTVKFQVHRIDVSLDRNSLAQLEVQPFGQGLADGCSRALRLKGLELFGRHGELCIDFEDPSRIGGETRKEILGPIVDIHPAEPGGGHQFTHAGHLADLLFVVFGKGEGQGNPISGHQPQGLLGRPFLVVEGVIDRKEHAQEKQRNTDAGHRQQRSPPVAQRILQSQAQSIPEHEPSRLPPEGKNPSRQFSDYHNSRRPDKSALGLLIQAPDSLGDPFPGIPPARDWNTRGNGFCAGRSGSRRSGTGCTCSG